MALKAKSRKVKLAQGVSEIGILASPRYSYQDPPCSLKKRVYLEVQGDLVRRLITTKPHIVP